MPAMPPVLRRVLRARGVEGAAALRRFLAPDLGDLSDPWSLPDMRAAVDVLLDARRRGASIGVAGDYDCDGCTASALVARVLPRLGMGVSVFTPERLADGYGLSLRALDAWAAEGVDTVLTVDTGTRGAAAVAAAAARGMRVVVTDHHQLGAETEGVLAHAAALVNPQRAADRAAHGWAELCGVGVAFALCRALAAACGADPEAVLWPHLPLVAVGTLGDYVPLVGDNRVLVALGLGRLRTAPGVGLGALAEVAQVDLAAADVRSVTWRLNPRINSPGRLGSALGTVALLVTDDASEAARLAGAVEAANTQRRMLSDAAVAEATARGGIAQGAATVVAGAWHPGIVGLVASRIAERTGRPACAVGYNPVRRCWTGSVRAPDALAQTAAGRAPVRFDVAVALTACAGTLAAYGGHEGAGGLTLAARAVDGATGGADAVAAARAFAAAFSAACAAQAADPARRATAPTAEAVVRLADLDAAFVAALRALAPYGPGHEPVRLRAEGVVLTHLRRMGAGGAHVSGRVRQEGTHCDVVAWEGGARYAALVARWAEGAAVIADITFHVELPSDADGAKAGRLRLVLRDVTDRSASAVEETREG